MLFMLAFIIHKNKSETMKNHLDRTRESMHTLLLTKQNKCLSYKKYDLLDKPIGTNME